MYRKNCLVLLSVLCVLSVVAQTGRNPSFEEVISLQSRSNALISPDGKNIIFEVQSADWEKNNFDRELWISKNGGAPIQLTNAKNGSSRNAKWSPNGEWIAFVSKRGEKTQIHAIRLAGGESFQLTNTEHNISTYEWSPDGKKIAFLQAEDKLKEEKQQSEKYGGFEIEDEKFASKQIWLAHFNPTKFNQKPLPEQLSDSIFKKELQAQILIDSTTFSVNRFKWSPDGTKLAIEHQPDPLINTFFKADISIYDIPSKTHTLLVNNSSYDGLVGWSPDGKSILYGTALNNASSNYYKNGKFFRINIDGTNNRQLANDFDEDLFAIQWNANGIFALSWQKTLRRLIHIDPESGATTIISKSPERIWNFSFTSDGSRIAYSGSDDNDLAEIYSSSYPLSEIKQHTNSSKQIEDWAVSHSEVISWKSKDGEIIEGVLHRPKDYDPTKKYPLLVIIHGGPTGISIPSPVPSYVYPIVQWLNKGALILQPNYRGSAGYGEKFRSLNVKNLGVGDAWDVLSGVDHLEKKGLVDGNRVGSMGWSQGGYISAFLTTNSDKFKAISVGAGISNWMTYYVNTDIHPFTRQYLKATPWSDKKIYEKTSPMTNITKAVTPTLIQHGEFDKRVPIANAYELFQGLQDVGVETKLIIYKGFGHGINKPKERLAATWHNWQWFGKYIWNEAIEVPME